MAEPSTHINYSFEDIQRYLNGGMSAAEMHAVEKDALQDPFLADAIEGYVEINATTARKHLNEIHAALFSEKKKSKVVAFNKKTQWLNVAALIIVLAGIAVISFFVINKPADKKEIAQLKKEEAPDSSTAVLRNSTTNEPAAQVAAPNNESSIAKNDKVETHQLAMKEKADVSSSNKKPQTDKPTVTMMAPPAAFQQQAADASSSADEATLFNKENDSLQTSLEGYVSGINITANTFTGKIVDQSGDPIPYATIAVNNKKHAVITDASGNFNIKNNDSALPVTISAVGYENATAFIKPEINNTIILNGNTTANDVVVTTALGIQRQQRPLSDSAMPVGGWRNFNNYVITQLNKDTTVENDMREKDLVELEFLIDKAGTPYDIKIVKPLDADRNMKAIDILKSGPKWTNVSKKKKARISISF